MPASKVTLLFKSDTINSANATERSAGFSETYYNPLAIDNPSLITLINGLCTKRAALLASNNSIVGQRIQTVDPVGPSRVLERKFPPGTTLENDLPGIALKFTVDNPAGPNQRNVILRGVPDARIVKGEYSASGVYNSSLAAFFIELSGNWKFRAIDRTIAPVKIVSIVNGLMTTAGVHGLEGGQTINVMSTIDSSTLKKVSYKAKVLTVPTTSTATLFPLGELLEVPDTVKGQMRRVSIIYPSISIPADEIAAPHATHRKVGAIFGRFRGRQTGKR